MTIRVCLIDDQPKTIEFIAVYLKRIPGYEIVARESDSIEALEKFERGDIVAELTFLDIDMPGLDGIALASRINRMTNIIFTTGHRQFGPESYELGAIGYIVKPLSYEKFLSVLDNAKSRIKQVVPIDVLQDGFLFIPSTGKGERIRVNFDDIIYIQGSSNYIWVFTSGGSYMPYMSLAEIEQKLPLQLFLRIHKSYIVNISKIIKVTSDSIYVTEEKSVPISETYKAIVAARVR